jgi:hypothetical protein
MPERLRYKRNDPLEIIVSFFNLINEETIYYSPSSLAWWDDMDEWDIPYKKNLLNPHYMIYNAIEFTN